MYSIAFGVAAMISLLTTVTRSCCTRAFNTRDQAERTVLTRFRAVFPVADPDGEAAKRSEAAQLSAEHGTRLTRMGLDPKYVGVGSENDLADLRDEN